MNILLLMAGSGDAFREAGFQYPKNLVEIEGMPLVQRVINNLFSLQGNQHQLICALRQEEVRKHFTADVVHLIVPGAIALEVNGNTAGAACTALLAIDTINNDQPLVIANGDQIIEANLGSIVSEFQHRELDGGIIVFEAVHPRWSYVRCNAQGYVVEAAEKRPISNLATAGFYYFARGRDFVTAAMNMIKKDAHVGGSFYVCPVYNEMLLLGGKVGVSKIPRNTYFSLASPQGVQDYADHLRFTAAQRLRV
jgi:dTDP-glucose pyrophosphorylase